MTLPRIPLGNTALDLTTAAGQFVQGLKGEQERRRKAALEEALLNIKAMDVMQPSAGDMQVIQVPTPEGPRFGRINKLTGDVELTDTPAPESQYFTVTEDEQGGLRLVATPRTARPDSTHQAAPVQMPPGQQPRDISPAIMPIETPQGPALARVGRRTGPAELVQQPGGGAVTPRATLGEVEKAQFGTAMKLADDVMTMVEQRALSGDQEALQGIDQVINRLALQRATMRIPLLGEGLAGTVQAAEQLGLSPQGAQYLAAMASFISNQVPARAGKQMTINEMLLVMREFVPGIGELNKPEAWMQKIQNRKNAIGTTLEAAGAGALRFQDMQAPPMPSTPQTPSMNPRFDPRKP